MRFSRPLLFSALGLLAAFPASAAANADVELQPGEPAEVYVAPGRATTLLFRGSAKIAAIALASPAISYRYDPELNQLEITAAARTAGVETNLNLRIGSEVYVLLVKVVNDVRAQFLRSFVPAGGGADDDEAELDRAPPLAPGAIDLVGAAKDLERAETDPIFRRSRADLRIEPIGRRYLWNGCLVTLAEAGQFLDRDLLVFRVQWLNRTGDALYLDPGQYAIVAAGQSIPIAARYKIGVGAVVYPGQLETVYLAVQGYRLSRHNDWQLGLPPDAAALGSASR